MEEDIRKVRFCNSEYDGDPFRDNIHLASIESSIAMVSNMADVALERVLYNDEMREDDKRALRNAASLLNTALCGCGIMSSKIPGIRQPSATYACGMIQEFLKLENPRALKKAILPIRQTIIETYEGRQQDKQALERAKEFFDKLADYSLEEDSRRYPAEIDRIGMGLRVA
ncbi:hypothetical protein HY450_02250 [Candidatus Pacearchaeota archaeon]|nr:hypothetical protein [Candidatus Pacearchaeota archaeon]